MIGLRTATGLGIGTFGKLMSGMGMDAAGLEAARTGTACDAAVLRPMFVGTGSDAAWLRPAVVASPGLPGV